MDSSQNESSENPRRGTIRPPKSLSDKSFERAERDKLKWLIFKFRLLTGKLRFKKSGRPKGSSLFRNQEDAEAVLSNAIRSLFLASGRLPTESEVAEYLTQNELPQRLSDCRQKAERSLSDRTIRDLLARFELGDWENFRSRTLGELENH